MTLPSLSPSHPSPPTPQSAQAKQAAALRSAAAEIEVTFLSEMLKSAGLGESRQAMGGGIGEDQFGSFLRRAQAEEMVKAGGIGLAEHLFQALKDRADVR